MLALSCSTLRNNCKFCCRLCEEKKVDLLDMNQSPQNWKDISVYGTNVSAIQHDIDLFVEKNFPNFAVQAHDLDDYLWFNEFNENSNLNGNGKISLQVYKLRPSPISGWKPIEVGRVACELALRAKTEHGDEAIYVGFPKPPCV